MNDFSEYTSTEQHCSGCIGPCGRCYTIDDYLNAIRREISKRISTYPNIIQKKEKKGVDKLEIFEEIAIQQRQLIKLIQIEYLFINPEITHISGPLAIELTAELKREFKMRKKCYPRMIYFKRITQETADYETAIWRALTEFFKSKYLTENV